MKAQLIILSLALLSCSGEQHDDRLYPIMECGQYGFINSKGDIVAPCIYDDYIWSAEEIPVKSNDKWGYIDQQGALLIDHKFDFAHLFKNDFARVKVGTRWGLINKSGEYHIEPKYKSITNYSEGIARGVSSESRNKVYRTFDMTGQLILSELDAIPFEQFSDGRALIQKDSTLQFIDNTGKVVIVIKGTHSYGFENGVARISRLGEESICIDVYGNIIAKPKSKLKYKDGWALVEDSTGRYYVDEDMNVVLNGLDDDYDYGEFSDGIARVNQTGWQNKLTAYMNKKGEIILPLAESRYSDFHSDRLVIYDDNNKAGFINKNTDTIIKPRFSYVAPKAFQNALCGVIEDEYWGYINRYGKYVWKTHVTNPLDSQQIACWQLDTTAIDDIPDRKIVGVSSLENTTDNQSITLSVDTVHRCLYKTETHIPILGDQRYKDDYMQIKKAYVGRQLSLSNPTNMNFKLSGYQGKVPIYQELFKNGKWKEINYQHFAFCGHSYYRLMIEPQSKYEFVAPISKGEIRTKSRYNIELGDTTYYSNEFYENIESDFTAEFEVRTILDKKRYKNLYSIYMYGNNGKASWYLSNQEITNRLEQSQTYKLKIESLTNTILDIIDTPSNVKE